MFLANNLPGFKEKFSQQLHEMLDSEHLGAFILVLANSMQDESLFHSLKNPLTRRFQTLTANTPDAPIDDQQVFQQLKTAGIEALTFWEYFSKDTWELVYNPLRAMRPARSSTAVVHNIQQTFNPDGFHFNKPFLQPEILWEGQWGDSRSQKNIRVLYNKFPFAPWHLLIVPEPEKEQPQFLTQQAHEDIFTLSTQCEHLPGLGIGYNSLGAHASINQLHFQAFITEKVLPVEAAIWKHNNGNTAYPLECTRYQNPQEAWQSIQHLHDNNQPYHLLYRQGYCTIIPRQLQGQTELPEWAQGAGWWEICGVFTLIERSLSSTLSSQEIYRALQKFKPTSK